MTEPTEHEQIEGLRAEALRRDDQIAGLEVEATRRDDEIKGFEAAALLRDERIAALVAEVDGLHKAMEHRAVIEQAKGFIMSNTGCGPEAAFAALVARSQNENRKLWEIATELANTRDDQTPNC